MADPYVSFPGTAGNYASRADTNLLDADTAHLQQSSGQYTQIFPATVVIDTPPVQPPFGVTAGRSDMDAGIVVNRTPVGGGLYPNMPEAVPVGDTTFLIYAYTDDIGVEGHGEFNWINAATGAGLGSLPGSTTPVPLVPGSWQPFRSVATPGGADWTGSVGFRKTSAGAATVWLSTAMLAAGDIAEFTPSLRIVGDLDLRADIALTQWADGADQTIAARWETTGNNRSVFLILTSTGNPQFGVSVDGSAVVSRTSTDFSLVDGQSTLIRVTQDTANIVFYENGVAVTTVANVGPPFVAAANLKVSQRATGANAAGDFYTVEVRDGIDGPIVAQFRAQDLIGAVPL